MPAPPADRLPFVSHGIPAANADAGIGLWLVDLAASGPALLALENRQPRLSEDDAQRAARADTHLASRAADAHREPGAAAAGGLAERRATYVALRLVVEASVGHSLARRPFARTPAGRPHVVDAAVDFSLSHTPGFALVGVAHRGRIGVDVERPRQLRMGPARRAAIEAAGAALAPDAPLPAQGDLRTLAAWVRIEAFAKAYALTVARVLTAVGAIGRPTAADSVAPQPVTPADVHAAAAALAGLTRASKPPRVSPLALPGDLVGAACWFPGTDTPAAPPMPTRWTALPTDRDGLDRLAAAGRDGR